MNENLANEVRKTIESVKDLKTEVGGINNHLGILEGLVRSDNQKKVDETYQRGYDKGYADKTNNDEVCKELAKDIYQRGLNDAWEAARKIVLSPDEGGTSLTDLFVMFGHRSIQSVFKNYSASEVIEKLKADKEIKVGDEVQNKVNGLTYIITLASENGYVLLDSDGNFGTSCITNNFEKTGRHFDIDKILEEMRT